MAAGDIASHHHEDGRHTSHHEMMHDSVKHDADEKQKAGKCHAGHSLFMLCPFFNNVFAGDLSIHQPNLPVPNPAITPIDTPPPKA